MMGNSEVTLSFRTLTKKQFQIPFYTNDTVGVRFEVILIVLGQNCERKSFGT